MFEHGLCAQQQLIHCFFRFAPLTWPLLLLVGTVLSVTFAMRSVNPILLTFVQLCFRMNIYGPAPDLKICRNKTQLKKLPVYSIGWLLTLSWDPVIIRMGFFFPAPVPSLWPSPPPAPCEELSAAWTKSSVSAAIPQPTEPASLKCFFLSPSLNERFISCFSLFKHGLNPVAGVHLTLEYSCLEYWSNWQFREENNWSGTYRYKGTKWGLQQTCW